jgi:multicomponent Na+:H+ antiporter subunit D
MSVEMLLPAVVLVPLIAALVALFLRGRALAALHLLTVPATLATSGALLALIAQKGPLGYPLGGWGAPLGIELYADGLAGVFVVLVGVVTAVGGLYAHAWPQPLEPAARLGRPLFWPLWYGLWASLNALLVSADAFNLYVALELITLAAVILVAQANERGVLLAAMRYLLAALIGSLLYLLGVALLYGSAGVLDLALLAERLEPGAPAWLAAGLMTTGLLIKAALFPFHFWLPPAHSSAAAPVSAALSGLVVKVYFYLLVRLWFGPFAVLAEPGLMLVLGLLGAGALLWGSLMAWRAERLKLLVAYSTVAQLGYLFLLFPLFATAPQGAWRGALFHGLAHGLAKAAAFLAAGNLLLAVGNDRLESIRGLGTLRLRMSTLAFGLAGVSLMGLPPSGGFVAKWLLLESAITGGLWPWALLLLAGSLLAAIYVFRVLAAAMATPAVAEIPLQTVPRRLEIAALTLALAAIVLGLAPALPLDLLAIGAPFAITPVAPHEAVEGFWLPILILSASFVPGVLVFFLAERQTGLRTVLNLTGATLKVLLVGVLLWQVYQGYGYETRLAFVPGIDLVLRADPLTLQFLTLSAGLWLVTTIYAIGYLEGSPDRSRFFGFFSLSVTATTGIALSGNLLTFLIFYELLTLATYPLVVHRGVEKSLAAGRVYLVYTVTGGALLLLGIVWLHAMGGNLEFSPLNSLAGLAAERPVMLTVIFALLIAGVGVKAALVPLHGWLPTAMVAPAPVSALLHAVAVVKAGVFGIIRVLYDIFGITFAHSFGATAVLAAVAGVTIVWGSLRALAQDEIKRRLAFSTVSQLSYIVLGAAIASPLATIGALVHLVHQGLMKITLFFCAGNLAEIYGIHKISQLDGAGRRMPVTMAAFTLAALGMIGLPPIAGFVSKWYLAGGGASAGVNWVVAVLVTSSVLNAAYFLPMVWAAWFRPIREERPVLRDAGLWLVAPPVATALTALAAGLFAGFALSPLGWAELISERVYYGVAPEP